MHREPITPLALARRYLEVFCAGAEMQALRPLLADGCRFRGPFASFDGADAYVAALVSDPPGECGTELIGGFEDGSRAALFFRFTKPGLELPMAGLFDTANGRITSILLVFDTAAFAATVDGG